MSSNATAIAIFEVDSGDRERVLTWQADLDAAAARSIGFVGAHFTRGFDEHDDWAAAVTFNSAANLRKWLDSPERAGLLEQGASYGARTGTTLTLLPGERPPAGVAVFLHRVAPENHVAFMQVETKLQRMSREFPGSLGGLLLAPAQPDGQWISVLRFTDDATLNAWLTSPERTAELSVLREYLVQDFEQVTRSTPFGSIVRVIDGQTRTTPNWKTAMVVFMVLFPTVMLLSRFLSPLLHDLGLDPGLSLWMSNIVSTILLTYLLMPTATRIFRFWLDPIDGAPLKPTLLGIAIILFVYALTLLAFAVFRDLQFWDYMD